MHHLKNRHLAGGMQFTLFQYWTDAHFYSFRVIVLQYLSLSVIQSRLFLLRFATGKATSSRTFPSPLAQWSDESHCFFWAEFLMPRFDTTSITVSQASGRAIGGLKGFFCDKPMVNPNFMDHQHHPPHHHQQQHHHHHHHHHHHQ